MTAMKYVDEFRDSASCEKLVERIRAAATRPWTLMEVCGGQTHGLLKYGIDRLLEPNIRLIHGPGCPVCVTPLGAIEAAIELSRRPDVVLTSFGDMLRVPGRTASLLQARADGARIQMVYSPLDAVQLAAKSPDRQVVFFAVGFETTIPATALAIAQAQQMGLTNFTTLIAHVRVQPAMEQLAAAPDIHVDGFLAAGHVCTVVGFESYEEFVQRFGKPVVVTGFEPTDLLGGILRCVELLESNTAAVENRYSRSAQYSGNAAATQWIAEMFEPTDMAWRGFGVVRQGGYRLREPYHQFDARRRFQLALSDALDETTPCRGGEVLAGKILPTSCEYFGRECTPESPLGAPMVSAEGACAAYFRYHGQERRA